MGAYQRDGNDANRGDQDWRQQANCLNAGPEFFFPTGGSDVVDALHLVEAKALCMGCEVQVECLDYALTAGPGLQGIWSGTDEAQRRRLRRGHLAASA